MTWPHVESDGILCLLPDMAECDPDDPYAAPPQCRHRIAGPGQEPASLPPESGFDSRPPPAADDPANRWRRRIQLAGFWSENPLATTPFARPDRPPRPPSWLRVPRRNKRPSCRFSGRIGQLSRMHGLLPPLEHVPTLVSRRREKFSADPTLLLGGGDTWLGSGTAVVARSARSGHGRRLQPVRRGRHGWSPGVIALSPRFRWRTTIVPGQPVTMEWVLDRTVTAYPETCVRELPSRYAASIAFSRCSHSSSSTISKRMALPRIAGASSAQSFLDACSVQMSNTERL